jgi:hypothetical protein
MKCETCGEEVRAVGKTKRLQPVNKTHLANKGKVQIPFYCKTCGAIDFKYTAVRDVAFIYPMPKADKIGLIYLPDIDYRGGNPQEKYKDQGAYVLSIGEECFDPKKKVYETRVPWEMKMLGTDGNMHKVVYCGFMDMYGVMG